MPIRITGMNSGLDTEALVTELVSAYSKKTEKYTKAQTKLSWKQNIWAGLNTKVKNFHSSLSNLRFSSAYNMKSASVSDATKAKITANGNTITGSYSLKIASTAKSGYLTGGELGSDITGNSNLSALGVTGSGTISVSVGGKATDINVESGTTISDFVSQLNSAGVKANYDEANHRIFVAASDTGKANDFSIVGTDANGMDALYKLGLSVNSNADVSGYKDLAKYALNTDGNAYITGYNADGTAITNGTYDATATEAAINNYLNALRDASTTITNVSEDIKYANAYKTVNDVDKNFANDAERQLFKNLITQKSLENVHVDANGELYDWKTDGTFTRRSDNKNFDSAALTAAGISLESASDKMKVLEDKAGFIKHETDANGQNVDTVDEGKVAAYKSAMTAIATYEGDAANAANVSDIQAAYAAGSIDTKIADLQATVDSAKADKEQYADLEKYTTATSASVEDKIEYATQILTNSITVPTSAGATRVDGTDAEIILNGATYTSTSNTFNINNLTIEALAPTGMNPADELSITVSNNTQGLYDKIKSFVKEYNTLINEMTSLYNAEVVKNMEPLTTDEKDAMTDSQIEEWEKKIKGSLLRRDDTLDSLISGMTSVMFRSYEINGKKYSLSTFGIMTKGLQSAANEQNALHISGDKDDAMVSGETDKLMTMLNTDPDTVVEFMKQFSDDLYKSIDGKMKATTLSSFNVVYNDKQMAQEYSDYTKTISKWEDKLADIEDSYYKKFAAMESALATLQAQQSNLASLLG